ncbi:uncharacterized protein EV422DRAFT_509145 [Fimicolochytrium jonesii]|uniref:uncharacterized protein n=1 Tax=Fimicolochytrium jonesii TaxID=1396493 RepID=UPI0022FF2C89|nr:uncharacterized protein EV422DRAFT_509145 [Fimicolochytrium jonesii]KAI8817319.1 hypothetical protein EV422DRAFT_509145 [Fimicolochytrium jonesii]
MLRIFSPQGTPLSLRCVLPIFVALVDRLRTNGTRPIIPSVVRWSPLLVAFGPMGQDARSPPDNTSSRALDMVFNPRQETFDSFGRLRSPGGSAPLSAFQTPPDSGRKNGSQDQQIHDSKQRRCFLLPGEPYLIPGPVCEDGEAYTVSTIGEVDAIGVAARKARESHAMMVMGRRGEGYLLHTLSCDPTEHTTIQCERTHQTTRTGDDAMQPLLQAKYYDYRKTLTKSCVVAYKHSSKLEPATMQPALQAKYYVRPTAKRSQSPASSPGSTRPKHSFASTRQTHSFASTRQTHSFASTRQTHSFASTRQKHSSKALVRTSSQALIPSDPHPSIPQKNPALTSAQTAIPFRSTKKPTKLEERSKHGSLKQLHEHRKQSRTSPRKPHHPDSVQRLRNDIHLPHIGRRSYPISVTKPSTTFRVPRTSDRLSHHHHARKPLV